MRVLLIGADFEENLGLGMIAAAAEAAGHTVAVLAFNQPSEAAQVVRRALEAKPDVIGLGVQFQHRAHEFLALSARLRAVGFAGHVTAGGQYPTLAWEASLAPAYGLDSVVLHDGEVTFAALLAALRDGAPWTDIAGLAHRDASGTPVRSAGRRLEEDLDVLPFARRYRAHTKHLGVPFIPIMGSRGCWGACTYCSITSFYRDARDHGGGRTVRLRSPENVAQEMAVLWHASGGDAIFCFHDDNFLLPKPAATLARVRAMRAALDGHGVGRAGLVGKCRPETVTPELARELRALGLLRLYVGVENASEHGAGDLNRGTQWKAVDAALDACREAGIFVCYNLLVFEPRSTLADVRENVRFMRAHAEHPVNFCRAEPYHGTPLQLDLRTRGTLSGSHLGWDYRLDDPRVEALFRVTSAAFRQRNFDPDGVANRYMGLGYSMKILEFFYDDPEGRLPALDRRARALTRGIVAETADFLDEALALAERFEPGDHDGLARETALLGLRIAAADRAWHAALDALYADMAEHGRRARLPKRTVRMPRGLAQIAQQMALGASIAMVATGLAGCGSTTTTVDPVPTDAGRDAGDARADINVVDPAPFDAGVDVPAVDPAPVDAGRDTGFADHVVVDPPPPDAGFADVPVMVDPLPPDSGVRDALRSPSRRPLPLVDQWRDTTPRRSRRDETVALWAPPDAALRIERDEGVVRVRVDTAGAAATTRWEGDGRIVGDGFEVCWEPGGAEDQLRVAVRTRGGVAVLALRACDVDRRARSAAELRDEA